MPSNSVFVNAPFCSRQYKRSSSVVAEGWAGKGGGLNRR